MSGGHQPADRDAAVVSLNGAAAARVVLLSGVALELAFLLLDYHVNYGRATDIGALRRLFNIAREDGLASWFASTQTLLVGITAWACWLAARAHGAVGRHHAGWLLVAMLFGYMALDDGVQLHERVGTAVSAVSLTPAWFPSFSWQLVFVPTLGLALLAAVVFLISEIPSRQAHRALIAAVLLFGLAVVLDFFEGLPLAHPWNVHRELALRFDLAGFTEARFGERPYDTLLHFSRAIEETCEMLATTLIWSTILRHAGTVVGSLRVRST